MGNQYSTLIKQVATKCQQRGKQFTATRKLVFKALLEANKAMSAYDLVDYCMQQFNHKIQAMSVYRTLEFLEHEHFVHKLKLSNKYVVCSHILCDHDHGLSQFLICSECDKISELKVDNALVSSLQSNAREEGFTMVQPHLEISGICDDCEP